MTNPTQAPPFRVLVIAEHDVLQRGVRTILQGEPDMVVVGAARTAKEAAEIAASRRPDLALLDEEVAGGSADAIRTILSAHPPTRVLLLTSTRDQTVLVDAISAGAQGLLDKEATQEELVDAVRAVASGRPLVGSEVTRAILERIRGDRNDPPSARLNSQEERILHKLGNGSPSRDIGAELHLSEGTVRNYVSRIIAKLGVRTRVECAAHQARRTGSAMP